MAPVILTATSTVAIGNVLTITGTGFGQVSGVALVNQGTSEYFDAAYFQIGFDGTDIRITVGRNVVPGTYEVLLGTLQGEHSTYLAAPFEVVLTGTTFPPEPVFPLAGTTTADIRTRLRYELGDYLDTFSASVIGDGEVVRFDLPVEAVVPTGLVVEVTNLGASPAILPPADYVLDDKRGVITLDNPLPIGAVLRVAGQNAQFFADSELDMFISSAVLKHTHNATDRAVNRDATTGRINISVTAQTIENLPAVEVHPVALLATIEALWTLAADASYDIDVTTAEGTSLPRSERYRAITQMIESQQARYEALCQQLNVGLNRIETFTLRRVSYTTGRLVPVYQPQEYNDRTPRTQVFAPVDRGVTGSGTTKRVFLGNQYPGP